MQQLSSVGYCLVLAVAACSSAQPQAGGDVEPSMAERPNLVGASLEASSNIVALRATQGWRVVNDGVMGGRSRSQVQIEGESLVFSGELSPDNGGGFASVRTARVAPLAKDVATIVLRVRGDGKRYQLRMRTDAQFDGPAYRSEFVAPAEAWQELRLPLSSFELSFRGRVISNAPALDPSQITQLGFLIAAKQWGAFRLEVESVRVE